MRRVICNKPFAPNNKHTRSPQCRNAVDLFMVSNKQGSDLWRVQLTKPGDETNKNADFLSPQSWDKISRFLGPAWKILEIVPRYQKNPGD